MAENSLFGVITDAVEAAFKELIESKHLYQSVKITWSDLESQIQRELRAMGLRYLCDNRWEVPRRGVVLQSTIQPRSVATFCARCKERQRHDFDEVDSFSFMTGSSQTFTMTFVCQACRPASVTFLIVRRKTDDGVKLTLAGRSEFEQAESPADIPKEQRRFYSDAVIAYNSGQYLPALFMLRTLIEQQMRASVESKDKDLRGEALCEAYAKTLENDFKRRYPSFRDIYDKLSEAIHEARADEALFGSERHAIEAHFRARTMYENAAKLLRPKSTE